MMKSIDSAYGDSMISVNCLLNEWKEIKSSLNVGKSRKR